MSLRARLTLAIVGLVGITSLLSWFVAGTIVLRPFAHAVFAAHLDQAVFVAEELEAGADPETLARRLGLEIEPVTTLPEARFTRSRTHPRTGRELAIRHGPDHGVFVASDGGWIGVRNAIEVERPGRRLATFLLVLTTGIIAGASWLAWHGTRPLQAAQAAMAAVAAGDLTHRLPRQGPRELRQVSEAFNGMADRIEELLRAEKQLMAGISHELRTPLARLRLALELLRDSGAAGSRVDAMEQDIAELDRLIGEILELSRLELGERVLVWEPTRLEELVAEVVDETQLPDHTVEVEGRGDEIAVDRSLLRRAVHNLLSNAGRYAPGGTAIRVVVADRTIAVEDEGPGVTDSDLGRLFDPFYRTDQGREVVGGVGLGLMIVRQVAVLHGGGVRAEARDGGGLRVVLWL